MKKSFFPHAGNKYGIIREILQEVPKEYDTYYEPFLGSGVVFINLRPLKAVLNDSDYFVYNAWKAIEENVDDTFRLCIPTQEEYNAHVWPKEHVINRLCGTLDTIQPNRVIEAACWINLKKMSYTSTVYHEKGSIQRPSGKKKVSLSKYDDFRNVSDLLKRCLNTITCKDYLEVLKDVRKGDFVYLDPPYLESNLQYVQEEDTTRLFEEIIREFKRLDVLGAYVMLSMEENDTILKTFENYNITKIKVWRYMSRRHVNELLIKNY